MLVRRPPTSEVAQQRLRTPVGDVIVVADDEALLGVLWSDRPEEWRRAGLSASKPLTPDRHPMLRAAAAHIDALLNGQCSSTELPMAHNGTDFQHAVWTALTHIDYGHTRTYAEVAADIGRPSAVRAVAGAIGRNPLSIVVPCHRVIGANGQLTGFAGGIATKAALLAIEGTIIPHDGQAHRRS